MSMSKALRLSSTWALIFFFQFKSGTPRSAVQFNAWFVLFLLILHELTGSLGQSSHHATTTPHTVNTKYGLIRGVKLQFSSSSAKHLDPVSAYLGIPYASPPINAYRFMPPVAPLPWSPGTRNAVTFSPACPQRFPDLSNRTRALQTMTMQRFIFLQKLIPHLVNQSEDCLYLNLYVPTVPPGEDIRPGKFAIVFVIHGESWEWGSGNEFDGAALASLGNHIVVTFNYRLGILGFLKTSNQQSNFGLLDVIAALHWVRENGETFGGDRNRITLLGYRTGAVIANLLLVAQIAKDLFQRAILISGSVLSPWALQKRPEEIALQVSHTLGCKGRLPLSHPESDLAPCLRQKHLSDLLNFAPESPRFLSPFAPYVDNVLLQNPKLLMESSQLSESEQFLRAQLLIVFTTSEGIHELNDGELCDGFESEHRDRLLRTLVRNVFNYHQQEIFSIIRNEYTDWERQSLHPIPLRDATVEAFSDCLVIAPSIQLALTHSKPNSDSTYLLHFSHVSREVNSTVYGRLGSLEGDVVPYVMGLPVTNNVPALGGQPFVSPWSSLSNFTKQDSTVSETLVHFLANFARTGNPNSNDITAVGVGIHTDLNDLNLNGEVESREKIRLRSLHWKAFEQSNQSYMHLGVKPRLKNHYRGHKLALWLNLIPQIHSPGGTDVGPNHHVFQDNNPSLYIGPVRQMYPPSFSDQIPGFGNPYSQSAPQKHFTPTPTTGSVGGLPITTTECIESTGVPPFPQGTGLSGIDQDLDEDVGVPMKGIGVDTSLSRGLGMREDTTHRDYDYSTALTVTLTVGVCLILLNLLVFSAIMCHRKRGLDNGLSVSTSDSPGSRHGPNGTPLKSPYQEDEFKWTSCSSSHGMNGEESYCSAHLSHPGDAISGLSQYNPGPCSQHQLQNHPHLDFNSPGNCCISPGGSLMRSHNNPGRAPSPLMMVMMSSTQSPGESGRHRVQLKQIPPNFIPPPLQSPPPGSIRLYMNKSAGDIDILEMPDSIQHLQQYQRGGNYCPISNCNSSTSTNTNSMSRTLIRQSQVQSPSSSGGTTTASVSTPTAGNPSLNSGAGTGNNTTLVGVLKRHNSSASASNSTVKKRVQIQEISV